MKSKGERRIAGKTDPMLLNHGPFIGLWALLLVLSVYLHASPDWLWALGWGLAPVLAGFAAFLAVRSKGPARWLLLTGGEALGVVAGSILAAGPENPLLLLVLWPVAWAALQLPLHAGIGLVAGVAIAHLTVGLWRSGIAAAGPVLLSTLLYLGTFSGAFLLLRQKGLVRAAPTPAPPPPQAEPAKAARPAEEAHPARDSGPTADTGPAPEVPRTETLPPYSSDDSLHQDLRVARDIQVSLLLASSPHLPGWEASTSFLPARELGGDLYDFVQLDPPFWGIMIGDVSGKGIPAALHMAVARTLFRIQARHHQNPAETLSQVNQSLIEQVPQGCVTLLYAHLNAADGTLRLANAGHNYPFILDQSVHEVVLDGLPLGIDKDYTFLETTTRLRPGDVLVCYTDGVVEAVNDRGEVFGFDRLQNLLAGSTVRRPRSLTRQIVRAVRAFTGPIPQSDDITLVVLRRRYDDRLREMAEVALDVLGVEGQAMVREELERINLPADAPVEAWRAAVLTVGGCARSRWGQGLSRELMQQLLLTLEEL